MPPQRVEPPAVVFVGDEVARTVEVDVLVLVAVGPAADLVDAAHANGPADEVGVAQGEVDGVVSAEAGADGDEERVVVLLLR